MNDQAMRMRILRVLEAIDFEQRERWARRIVCSSIGAGALVLGLNGCLPPGPAGWNEPAPIAQPDLGGCLNCEYAAPHPIEHQAMPKYAADIDQVPRPAYALAEPRPIPVPPYSVAMPPEEPRPVPVPAYGIRPEPNVAPVSKYAIPAPHQPRPIGPTYQTDPGAKPVHNDAVARYGIALPRE